MGRRRKNAFLFPSSSSSRSFLGKNFHPRALLSKAHLGWGVGQKMGKGRFGVGGQIPSKHWAVIFLKKQPVGKGKELVLWVGRRMRDLAKRFSALLLLQRFPVLHCPPGVGNADRATDEVGDGKYLEDFLSGNMQGMAGAEVVADAIVTAQHH